MKQLKLPPELTLFTAELVADQWRELISLQEEIRLEGSQVQVIDGCGLQLVLAFQKALQIEGQQLQIVNPSGIFEQVLAEMGMTEIVRRGLDGKGNCNSR